MKTLVTLAISLLLSHGVSANCSLTMGYKESAKIPLINASPDNSGIYLDLYTQAAGMIGCELEVVRLPKKRLHRLLASGDIDFYPGASFSIEREKYLYFIKNGLTTGQYGVTLSGRADIENYQQLAQPGVVWMMELGSSKLETAKSLGIHTLKFGSISFNKAKLYLGVSDLILSF